MMVKRNNPLSDCDQKKIFCEQRKKRSESFVHDCCVSLGKKMKKIAPDKKPPQCDIQTGREREESVRRAYWGGRGRGRGSRGGEREEKTEGEEIREEELAWHVDYEYPG